MYDQNKESSSTSIIPPYFRFELIHQSKKSAARVGLIHTPHGTIQTPNFVAVGTNGTLKAIDSLTAQNIGLQLVFYNSYHLLLQPGREIIKAAGGLHRFTNRTSPIITDSGGFQVFSLAYGTVKDELKSKGKKKGNSSVLAIEEEGVTFRSYRNGDLVILTPEISIQAQKDFGADIIIAFDELPPYHIDRAQLINSLHRTHRWQERSLAVHQADKRNQALYAVIHGGVDKELRTRSCSFLTARDFEGFAIGGSLGKSTPEMIEMLSYTMPQLPKEKPNHLLGIGDLPSITAAIPLGIDTFDSSYPTRCARHGLVLTKNGNKKILQRSHALLFEPLEKDCSCFTCQHYTAAYIHHLFKAHEMTAYTLVSIHNLHFMVNYMKHYQTLILHDLI